MEQLSKFLENNSLTKNAHMELLNQYVGINFNETTLKKAKFDQEVKEKLGHRKPKNYFEKILLSEKNNFHETIIRNEIKNLIMSDTVLSKDSNTLSLIESLKILFVIPLQYNDIEKTEQESLTIEIESKEGVKHFIKYYFFSQKESDESEVGITIYDENKQTAKLDFVFIDDFVSLEDIKSLHILAMDLGLGHLSLGIFIKLLIFLLSFKVQKNLTSYNKHKLYVTLKELLKDYTRTPVQELYETGQNSPKIKKILKDIKSNKYDNTPTSVFKIIDELEAIEPTIPLILEAVVKIKTRLQEQLIEEILESDNEMNPDRYNENISFLGRLKLNNEKIQHALTVCLKNKFDSVRIKSAEVLCSIEPNHPEAVRLLMSSLRHSNHYTRQMACEAIGSAKLKDEKIHKMVAEILDDVHYVVRAKAAWALAQLKPNDAAIIKALEKSALHDNDKDVRLQASLALKNINAN